MPKGPQLSRRHALDQQRSVSTARFSDAHAWFNFELDATHQTRGAQFGLELERIALHQADRLKHAQQRVQRSLGVFLSSTMLLFRPDARLRAAFLALLLAGLTPDPRSPIHRLAQRLSSFASSDTAQRRASGTWTQTLGLDQAPLPPLLLCCSPPSSFPRLHRPAPLVAATLR